MRFFSCLLLVLSCAMALFHDESYSYIPFVIVVCLVGSTGILHLLYRKIQVVIGVPDTNSKNKHVQLSFQKPNRMAIQGSYSIVCQHSISFETQILTGTFRTTSKQPVIEIPVLWHYCGQMTIPETHIFFEDTFSIHKTKLTIAKTQPTILWPTIQSSEFTLNDYASQQDLGFESGANERITPYAAGDSIHSIHWPLSAKLQELIVQKPAYAIGQLDVIALYFNDVHEVNEYDEFMNICYSLLVQPEISRVAIWTDHWQEFSTDSKQQVDDLFYYLLSQSLSKLHASEQPNVNYALVRLKEGHLS